MVECSTLFSRWKIDTLSSLRLIWRQSLKRWVQPKLNIEKKQMSLSKNWRSWGREASTNGWIEACLGKGTGIRGKRKMDSVIYGSRIWLWKLTQMYVKKKSNNSESINHIRNKHNLLAKYHEHVCERVRVDIHKQAHIKGKSACPFF